MEVTAEELLVGPMLLVGNIPTPPIPPGEYSYTSPAPPQLCITKMAFFVGQAGTPALQGEHTRYL